VRRSAGRSRGRRSAAGARPDRAVTDGAHTAHIALLGQYTTGEFSAKSDGSSGTLIAASGPSPAETTSATLAAPTPEGFDRRPASRRRAAVAQHEPYAIGQFLHRAAAVAEDGDGFCQGVSHTWCRAWASQEKIKPITKSSTVFSRKNQDGDKVLRRQL
jgi:hypothetical protein